MSEVIQLCLTLCDPVDCSPPVSSIHGILQARILEWVAIVRPQKKNPGKQEHYLFNFMNSELALPPDGISICSHKSQYFPVSPFTIDFYVGHINSM